MITVWCEFYGCWCYEANEVIEKGDHRYHACDYCENRNIHEESLIKALKEMKDMREGKRPKVLYHDSVKDFMNEEES